MASLPPREAWIEIKYRKLSSGLMIGRFPRGKRGLKSKLTWHRQVPHVSLPPREAWIEIQIPRAQISRSVSLPPREAWIEIEANLAQAGAACVASPAGSVD